MRKADSLEKTLILGKIEGRRRRAWQRMRWLDGITIQHEFEQTPGDGKRQGSLACCSPWGHRVRHNWATTICIYITWKQHIIINQLYSNKFFKKGRKFFLTPGPFQPSTLFISERNLALKFLFGSVFSSFCLPVEWLCSLGFQCSQMRETPSEQVTLQTLSPIFFESTILLFSSKDKGVHRHLTDHSLHRI